MREYAYKNVLKYKSGGSFETWILSIENIAIGFNNFKNTNNPLPINEIKATARSVAKWTWKNFDSDIFSQIQSLRGSKNKGKTKSKVKPLLDFIGDKQK